MRSYVRSEQENLRVVQDGYKAFGECDFTTLRQLLDAAAEWNFHPTYSGIRGRNTRGEVGTRFSKPSKY